MAWELRRLCFMSATACALVLFAAGALADEANQGIIDMAIEALNSGDAEMQSGAITILREMPGEAVTKVLAEQLPKLSPGVQVQLLAALGDRGDASALPAVSEATKSAEESVRVAALQAVGQLGDASSVPLLAERAAGVKGNEQKAARESLYRLRGERVDAAILQSISSVEPPVQVELITAIGERNTGGAIDTLLAGARQEERRVRLESLRVLRILAGPEDLPVLMNLLLDIKDDPGRTEAEKTVAAVARKIEDPTRRAAPVLAVLPNVKETTDRASLLRVLGRIGDNSALATLQTDLTSREPVIQDAAVRALADWPTPEPLPDLLKVAQTTENRVHKVLALRGFVRMLGFESDRAIGETIELYRKAMDLAGDAAEKKLLLSGLAAARSPEALDMAAQYLDDVTLYQEAESAALKIAEAIHDDHPQQTRDVLEKLMAGTKNDAVRQQAKELIELIDSQKTGSESQK